jgi:hypothetical protein
MWLVLIMKTALKRNLPIVSAMTAIDLPSGESILLIIHEGIYHETAAHSENLG